MYRCNSDLNVEKVIKKRNKPGHKSNVPSQNNSGTCYDEVVCGSKNSMTLDGIISKYSLNKQVTHGQHLPTQIKQHKHSKSTTIATKQLKIKGISDIDKEGEETISFNNEEGGMIKFNSANNELEPDSLIKVGK